MKSKSLFITFSLFLLAFTCSFGKAKGYLVKSPDKRIVVKLALEETMTWSIHSDGKAIILPSAIQLRLSNGQIIGRYPKVLKAAVQKVASSFETPVYKKKSVQDVYNLLTLDFDGGFGLQVRVYNDGAAYRLVSKNLTAYNVTSETAEFNFGSDHKVFIPYVNDPRVKGDKYLHSFEALYTRQKLSELHRDSLAFLPLLVDLGNDLKAAVLDVNLENYPGMLVVKGRANSLSARFAGYPEQEEPGGYRLFNSVPIRRANYIAKVNGPVKFPWRAVVITRADKDLLNNDMVQKLAEPSRISDPSWIRPGKVAWEWWNDWNITGVDFRAGINNATYKYYIDFAAANKLEYVVLDEGWSDPTDLNKLNPEVSVSELVEYGRSKDVGLILWASWRALWKDLDNAFEKYSKLGIKGFKIDFLDRDDQVMTNSTYIIAQKAAEHKLLIDLHGVYKPDGLQRTYPNVVNYEGVKGLENSKWAPNDDVPLYDVTVSFIRMLAGPMDYTPGALRNVTKGNFYPSNSRPMSHGTRAHQVAMYVAYEAPLQMLADSPTEYIKEQETCTYISRIPTVFDETVPLAGKVGEFVAVARRKGDIWYVGALTNWTPRYLELDLSFLGNGVHKAEVFADGINADRNGEDYILKTSTISKEAKMRIQLSPGGGWTAIITKER
ncbi:glycoside hydrolase family 97 protein [Pedobacter sp. SYSU D00535]|uniref:glycoside hydrolase family 97 protein n=1 Tax=Pedobacter sp. SYSU D00535 TaxID=2810308 RepID=UPI001A95C5B9|nr:glycoside hydrolase family 97 protein [Pedobacter sp. SYSU D00535]